MEQTHPDEFVLKGTPMPRLRRLPFYGAKNFRDLGGYSAGLGRTVRWGLLYRSDSLHALTESDLNHLSALHLERVIDFRAAHEVERDPDRLPGGLGIQRVDIPILDSSTQVFHEAREDLVKSLKKIDPAGYMLQTNVELATRFAPEMQRFVQAIMAAQGRPILFHCAAGKDRTGFAAALLLRILGVGMGTVMEDYLLTNRYFVSSYKWQLRLMRLWKGRAFVRGIKAFMEARPGYLSAAFETIDRHYGSFAAYVCDGLGFSDKEVADLQRWYLE